MGVPARQARLLLQAREVDLHEAIAAFLDLAWPEDLPWTHFPAGENRGDHVSRVDPKTGRKYTYSPAGARLKRMGLKAGWLDFQFILPNGQFACADAKRQGEDFTGEQPGHVGRLRALGVVCAKWFSVEDAERDCARWLAAFGRSLRASLVQTRGRP